MGGKRTFDRCLFLVLSGLSAALALVRVSRDALCSLASQKGYEFRGIAPTRSKTFGHFLNGPAPNFMCAIFAAALLHGQGARFVARSFEGGHDLVRIGGPVGFGAQVEIARARGRALQLILPLRAGG